jgi:hypothetical protein
VGKVGNCAFWGDTGAELIPGKPLPGGDVTVGAPGLEKGLDIGAVGVKEKVEPPLVKDGAFEVGALKLKLKAPALGGDVTVTGAEGCGLEENTDVPPNKLDVFPNTGAVVVCCAPNSFCSGGLGEAAVPNVGRAVVEPKVNGLSTGFVVSKGVSSFFANALPNPPNAGAGLGAGDPNGGFVTDAPNVNPVFFSSAVVVEPELKGKLGNVGFSVVPLT